MMLQHVFFVYRTTGRDQGHEVAKGMFHSVMTVLLRHLINWWVGRLAGRVAGRAAQLLGG